MAKYHETHKCYANKQTKAWYEANKDKHKSAQKEWHLLYPEYWTVKAHWTMIFGSKPKPTYINMPFFDEWNPRKGGSFLAGVRWLVETLGPRPDKTYQLHIIQKDIGFVPGNLVWVPLSQHKRREFLSLVLEDCRQLKIENQRLMLALAEKRANA